MCDGEEEEEEGEELSGLAPLSLPVAPLGHELPHLSPNSYIQPTTAPQWDDRLCNIMQLDPIENHSVILCAYNNYVTGWPCCTFFQFGQSQIFPAGSRYAQFGHYSVYLRVPHILPGEGHTKILQGGCEAARDISRYLKQHIPDYMLNIRKALQNPTGEIDLWIFE